MANDIKFSEVIYCSSQKSIITGMAGFQVRTHTASIDSELIEALSNNGIYGYPLSSERQVSLSHLQENPAIVTDYPQTFVYKQISSGGTNKYVFARTVYIGIDYGYFCGLENLRRAGSNYLTHALIFDVQPPQEVFTLLLSNNYFQNNVFLPIDYTCLPTNPELGRLLTGEPQYLSPNAVNTTGDKVNVQIADYAAELIIGVVQLYICRRLNNSKHLIVKVSNNVTNYLCGIMKAVLPEKLVASLSFQSNYNKDGVPDDIDVVFVNEHYTGTLYEADHICIDYFSNNHIGIEDNYIYAQIRQLVLAQNVEELKSLLEYLCEIDIFENSDYRFIYYLFVLTKSHQEIKCNELSFEFLQQLSKINLSGDNKNKVWHKINSAINTGLCSNDTPSINTTLNLCSDISKLGLVKECSISKASTTAFSKFLFDVPYNFGDIVTGENYKTAINFTDKEAVGNNSRLFAALNSVANYEVWSNYIKWLIPSENIYKDSSIIIEHIATSNLNEQSLDKLVDNLYASQKSIVLSYLNSTPSHISKFKKLLVQWVNAINLQQLSSLVSSSQYDNTAFATVKTIVRPWFENRINSTNNTIKIFGEFNEFVKTIGTPLANSIGVAEIVDKIAEEIDKNPSEKYRTLILELSELKVKINTNAAQLFNQFLKISSEDIPQHVDLQVMLMAYQLNKSSILGKLFNSWMKQGLSLNDLRSFIVVTNGLENHQKLIAHILIGIWQNDARGIRNKRKQYIDIVIDNAKWQKQEKSLFLNNVDDESLLNYISKSSSFINKLIRKIFSK